MGMTRTVGVGVLCVIMSHMVTVVTSSDDQLKDYRKLMTRSAHDSKRRDRRAAFTNQAMKGFSQDEIRMIVQKHNSLRDSANSSNMMYMYWDKDLEDLAQWWVERCVFEHSPSSKRYDVGPYSYVGENLFASSGSFEPDDVVQAWHNEIKSYDYNTSRCYGRGPCGHYTQVVWANSYALGCGVRYCSKLQYVGEAFFVSCNYGPGGNGMAGVYKKGKECTDCTNDTLFCANKLCAKFPMIGASDVASLDLLLIGCLLVVAILAMKLIT